MNQQFIFSLIKDANALVNKIAYTEEEIADIDKIIQQEDSYDIFLSVHVKGFHDSGEITPDGITRADLISVLKAVRDRNSTALEQLHGELKEVISKIRGE